VITSPPLSQDPEDGSSLEGKVEKRGLGSKEIQKEGKE